MSVCKEANSIVGLNFNSILNVALTSFKQPGQVALHSQFLKITLADFMFHIVDQHCCQWLLTPSLLSQLCPHSHRLCYRYFMISCCLLPDPRRSASSPTPDGVLTITTIKTTPTISVPSSTVEVSYFKRFLFL